MKSAFGRAEAGATSVLVLFPGALGDAVCAQPAMAALAAAGRLTVYARGAAAEVLRLFPAPPASVRALDAPEIARLFAPRRAEDAASDDAVAWLSAFDRIVSFTGAGDDAFRARLAATGRAVVCPFPRATSGPRACDVFLRLATGDPGAQAGAPRLLPPAGATGRAGRAVRRGRGAVLAIHPGAGAPAKRCPPEVFRGVGERWRRDVGGGVAVLLGPAEADEADRWSTLGETVLADDVADLAAAIAAAAAYVGCDSGPSHVAAALGAAGVALFAREEPGAFAPRGPRMSAIHVGALPAHAAADEAWRALRRRLP